MKNKRFGFMDKEKRHSPLSKAEEYIKKQEYAEALNCVNEALSIDKNNKEAKTKKEQLLLILKAGHTDIYASTNLNMDPWFE